MKRPFRDKARDFLLDHTRIHTMESLGDILAKKKFEVPVEVTRIKGYVEKRYGVKAKVTMQGKNLILSVPNSALAGNLQLEKPKILKACDLKCNLIIRVGR